MRIAIVAGEASGDILGAGLIAELKKRYPSCVLEGIGGEKMLAHGFHSFFPLERLAVMGLVEPLKRLPELLRIRKFLKNYFIENPPDLFIGIDAPDFNLTLEGALKSAGIKTAHYVSPSVWAWRQGRIKKIKRSVDLMLTLFPHEKAFYIEHDVNVACVGHALADQIPLEPNKEYAVQALGLDDNKRYIALLPGSRSAEVKYLWEPFLTAAQKISAEYEDIAFITPAANASRKSEIEIALDNFNKNNFSGQSLPLKVFDGRSHDVMLASEMVVMASGTTTLEAMLLKKPMVIAYKMASLSFAILSRLVKIKHIGLPNLLANKTLVPELIQSQVTTEQLVKEIKKILDNPAKSLELQQEFLSIHKSLKLNASVAAANELDRLLVEAAVRERGLDDCL